MPFIRTSLPEAGDDINGVRFVPHPDGGKVSAHSVPADLAAIFCGVPGFDTCPDPGFPAAQAAPAEQPAVKVFEALTVDEHRAEIERLEGLIAEHQSAIIAAGLAALKEAAPAQDAPPSEDPAKQPAEGEKPAEEAPATEEAKATKKR